MTQHRPRDGLPHPLRHRRRPGKAQPVVDHEINLACIDHAPRVSFRGDASSYKLKQFHTLRREQWIERPVGEVFAFFSDARNLAELTPPWLGFRVLTPGPIRLAAGARIRYRIGWHGVPVGWTTEIRRWEPPHRFIDVQLSGPYQLWHHTHRFDAHEGRTRMTDVVRYRLPFGPIGRVIHALKVRRDLGRIFEYRFRRINELFAPAR